MAADYHFKLCRAMFVGSRRHLQKDWYRKYLFIGVFEAKIEADPTPTYQLRDADGEIMKVQIEDLPVYRDDISVQLLDPMREPRWPRQGRAASSAT